MMLARPSALSALAFAIQSAAKFDYPADRTLSYVLREKRVGSQDRVVVAEGYYAWLRHRLSVEAIAGDGAKFDAIALAALARQFRRRVKVPPGEDDRYAKFLKADEALGPHPRRELPTWLWDRLGAQYGNDDRLALADALLEPAAFDLRVNTLKAKRDTILGRLQKEGFPDARATPLSLGGDATALPIVASIKQSDQPILLAVTSSPSAATLLTRYVRGYRAVIVGDLAQASRSVPQLAPEGVVIDSATVALFRPGAAHTSRRVSWSTTTIRDLGPFL